MRSDVGYVIKKRYAMELFKLLQIAGGSFPIGGFSQSYGLETYMSLNKINTCEEVRELIETYVTNILARNDLPLLISAYKACERNDYAAIDTINELALAVKITKESREASNKSGKAMMRIGKELVMDGKIDNFYSQKKHSGIAFNVAFAIIAKGLNTEIKNAVEAFAFNSVNGLVQAAIKLMPLGNVEGQKLLFQLLPTMESACSDAFEISPDEISSFAPAFDLASIEHENLTTRLYMS